VERVFLRPQYEEGDPVLNIDHIIDILPEMKHRSKSFTGTFKGKAESTRVLTLLIERLSRGEVSVDRAAPLPLSFPLNPAERRAPCYYSSGTNYSLLSPFFPCFSQFLVTSLSTASVLLGQGINLPFHALGQLQLL